MWSCKIEQTCINSKETYIGFCKIEQACINSKETYIGFCKIEQACSIFKQGIMLNASLFF